MHEKDLLFLLTLISLQVLIEFLRIFFAMLAQDIVLRLKIRIVVACGQTVGRRCGLVDLSRFRATGNGGRVIWPVIRRSRRIQKEVQ